MQQPNDREEYDSFVIPPTAPTDDIEDDDADQTITTIEADGKRQLIGYAVVWGAISSPRRDGFKHQFFRGSITWTSTVFALWHHDYASPLASTGNSTLTVIEDDHGAKVTIDLDATTDGNNAFERVKNRLVDGMSFGGRRLAYDRTDDPKVIKVTAFIADEVSVTIIPAMAETAIVTAAQTDDLQKSIQQKKESDMRIQKTNLAQIKLALLRP
jgi:HK97 family phage prohead protease